MRPILFNHDSNQHSFVGAEAGIRVFLSMVPGVRSLLDVGAGAGYWLKAALDAGVSDVFGVDGVSAEGRGTAVNADLFQTVDLRQPLHIGRRFDVVLCLEVAEHLDAQHANTLVDSLCRHSDSIIFSAACPGQRGQHHFNCQWPAYWQALFNKSGFVGLDTLRWRVWHDARIEPWYRQNVFLVSRDPARAGDEDRIPSVIHPDMVAHLDLPSPVATEYKQFVEGALPPRLYASLALRAAVARLPKKLW